MDNKSRVIDLVERCQDDELLLIILGLLEETIDHSAD